MIPLHPHSKIAANPLFKDLPVYAFFSGAILYLTPEFHSAASHVNPCNKLEPTLLALRAFLPPPQPSKMNSHSDMTIYAFVCFHTTVLLCNRKGTECRVNTCSTTQKSFDFG